MANERRTFTSLAPAEAYIKRLLAEGSVTKEWADAELARIRAIFAKEEIAPAEEELNKEVLRLTREGLTTTAVGARLNLPIAEVKRHLEAVGFPVTRADYSKGMQAADIRREIVRLHYEGKTPETIAHELRQDLGYVVRRLRQADLEPHTEPEVIKLAAEKYEEILALGREGVPRHEIAERLGVPWDIVAEALDKARIKPTLPACADIATWVRTLSPIIEEIRVSVPNAEPILAKANQLEKKLVSVSKAATKALEMIPMSQENSERYCLGDACHLINESINLAEALKGCIEQREVAELPRLLDQAETCIEDVSNIMTGTISEIAEKASIASPKSATGGENMAETDNPGLAEREARRVLGLPEVGPEIKAIVEEAAVKASELTGSKIVEQVAKELSGQVLHQSPISLHCERVLETPVKCYDFRGVRSYVLCKAWDILEREKRTRLPVGEAWSEVRRVCVME